MRYCAEPLRGEANSIEAGAVKVSFETTLWFHAPVVEVAFTVTSSEPFPATVRPLEMLVKFSVEYAP
jgi:hypothetical protein